jgi:glycosyltransferase involved in cell wall biosynthesis
MRLLFLSLVYPNRFEPTKGTFNQCLVDALSERHEIRVIAPVQWPVSWGLDRKTTARLSRDPDSPTVPVSHPTFYYPPKVMRPWYGRFLWASVRNTVRRMLLAFRPDAVIGYWAHPDGEAVWRAAREARAPCGLVVGGSDLLLLTREPGRRRAIVRVLEATDAIFTVGDDLRRRALELGIPPAKLHEFRQGVDTERFHPGDRGDARRRLGLDSAEPLLLWVGRMHPVKGLEVLVEAFAILAKTGSPARLALVGDGPQRAAVAALVAARGLAARTLFVGSVAHHELPDWYRAADLTVLSSWSEGIPNVLLESLASGVPFVASRVGSIAEVAIDPERDLVPPGDAPALAAAIGRRLAQSGERRAIVRYRWADTASAMVATLESLAPQP